MRQLGTLPDPKTAQALAGYLQTRAIETRLEPIPEGVAVWVLDEDKVAQARQEYQQFLLNPNDERYRQAPPPKAEPPTEEQPRRRTASNAGPWSPDIQVTLSLIVLCVVFTILYWSPAQQPLIAEYLFRQPVRIEGKSILWPKDTPPLNLHHGQVWRLVTPIFIHFDFWHLAFNTLALSFFATQIEERSGSVRLLLLVLLLAVISNECQYLLRNVDAGALLERLNPGNWFSSEPMTPLDVKPGPAFGGISGVVYGLFGYVWMRSLYDRSSELYVSGTNVVIMMVWLFLCMTGEVGPVANIAHVTGLFMGLFAGYGSAWWNRFGYREG